MDNIDELIGAGLPRDLPGGLAALAITHREELFRQTKEVRGLRANLNAALSSALKAAKTRGGNSAQGVLRNSQRFRSNVGTLMLSVSTLDVPTLALTLLLAHCANTFQACCWHTIKNMCVLRAVASKRF